MDTTRFGIIAYFVFMTALLVALVILLRKKHRPSSKDINKAKNKKNDYNFLLWVYQFYKNTPFLDKYLAKTKNKVQILYPADNFSVVKKTSKILAKGTIAAVIGIVLTVILGRTDLWFFLSGLLITYLLVTGIVNNSLEKMENIVLDQFAEFLSSFRHKYHEVKIPITALALTLDDLPYEISLHIQNIYDVVTSNSEYEIDQYFDIAPNQYILMFLSIFTSINEYGDKTLEDGTSLLLTDINYLKEEVNNDRLLRNKKKYLFMGLKTLALAPVIAIKPFASWATRNMPDLSSYYTGTYGIISMVVIFATAFLTYTLIVALRDDEKEVEKDSNVFSKIAAREPLSTLLNKEIKKRYREYEEYDNDMQALGDHSGPKAFLLKRITYCLGIFLVTFILLFYTNISQKMQYLNDWTNSFSDSVTVNEEYSKIMQQTGREYAKEYRHKDAEKLNEDDVTSEIMSHTDLTSAYAKQVTDEVMTRIQKYQQTYFRWWYLLICLVLAGIGYMIPVWILQFKHRVIETRKQEEVVQFQSLILILMYMDGVTVASILEWMERFSYCFREDIAECRVNLSGGEREALMLLRDSQRYAPFKDFIENMLAIDRVGVVDAFDEIRVDRAYYKENRKDMTEQAIQKKANVAQIIAFIPFGMTEVLYLIVPILMYAFTMLTAINESFT